MRIAYVGLHLENKIMNGGVGRKIFSHIRIWQEYGNEARLFLLTPDSMSFPNVSTFEFKPKVSAPKLLRRVSIELERSRALGKLIQAIADYQPDIIYLRFGLFTFPLLRLFAIAPVVVELNTRDVEEYRYRGSFFYWLNRISRRWTLGHASGLVAVSHEIKRANEGFGNPVKMISNGIDLQRFQPLAAPCNETPTFAFVGTPGYNWHGIDKLARFAARFPDIHMDFIGFGQEDLVEKVPDNLKLHGFLGVDEVRAILARADVVFGTAALHRKQMQETSPLKVREALAYGTPMVLPYTDTDFMDGPFDYLMQIPNDENNLDTYGEQVRAFGYQMRGKRVDFETVLPRIDQREKEKERLAFFQQLIREKTG